MDMCIAPRANAPFQAPIVGIGQDGENRQRSREGAQLRDRNNWRTAAKRTSNPGLNAPTALVYRPARNPMQSGPRIRKWVLQLEAQRPLSLDPLMGWTSGDDPARHIRLEFLTREAAIAFGEAQGWRVYSLPGNPRKPVLKSYRDNFVFKQPQPARKNNWTSTDKKSSTVETCEDGARPACETEDRNGKHLDPLDEALESTFPASDPLPLWSGRIGPPARMGGETD
jgi:NADH dehydrogenase ubiquinone Fe-S protein 4